MGLGASNPKTKPSTVAEHKQPAPAMTSLLNHFNKIGVVIALVVMTTFDATAQDDPNADARADMERGAQEQDKGVGAPTQLTPNMNIVPGGQVAPPETPVAPPQAQPQPQMRGPRADGARRPEIDDRNRAPRRDGINRHPREPRYNPPRRDDVDRNPRPPRYRPPPVIVRPYYPPPVYVPRYDPPPWVGPVPARVIWDPFPRELYDSLSYGVRTTHERAFIAALSNNIGITQTWRAGQLRGEIAVIDEGFYGSSFCRDVVQTIRTPWFRRTVDGRVCLRRGQAWRLVTY
jgi:hypothetical protein